MKMSVNMLLHAANSTPYNAVSKRLVGVLMRKSVEDRFWPKVARRGDDDCWLWTASKLKSGYGLLGSDYRGEERLAHRISWALASGEDVPKHICVLHSCDNPSCVNPKHLWLGTHADNTADKVRKGRQRSNGNENKTHCPQGHEYAGANLYVGGGRRFCITCKNADQLRRYHERKALACEDIT
jgi:hypothetical protein